MYKLSFILLFAFFVSCNNRTNKPDVSDIKVDIQVDRFEKSFFAIDTNNIAGGLANLRNAYPKFYPTFMQDILQINPVDTATHTIIKTIISSYRTLNDTIQDKYKNFDFLRNELTDDFKYVKYYFPNYKVPRIITFIGTLDAPGAVLTPDYLAIGLHQYAGKNFSAYQSADVQQLYPSYISRRFDKEYMATNSMKAVADDIYADESTGKPLIEQMVEKGKQWFLLDHFAPDAPDSVKTGYTQKQLDWAKENEGNVWGFIVKNENLYSIEPHVIQNYIGESPFTQGMPETSPGNIGQWIGWRIVQKFADKNDKMTLQEILHTPAKAIFEGSAYRPK
jgi:hypothetical protein